MNQLVWRSMSSQKLVTEKISEENKKQSEECFQVGKKHMMRKEYEQALNHYCNAIVHNPHNFRALCNMGSIYKEHSQYNQAQICYNKALLQQPNDYITLYNLGNLERLMDCNEIAISHYNKVLSLKQKQGIEMGEVYYNTILNRGICYKNLRLFDEAIVCYDNAIEINSKDPSGHFNKAMCLLKKIYGLSKLNFSLVKKKLCEEAQKSLQNVLFFDPNSFIAKVCIAEIIYLTNNNEQNLQQFIKQLLNLKEVAPNEQIIQINEKIKFYQNLLPLHQKQKVCEPIKQDNKTIETQNIVVKKNDQKDNHQLAKLDENAQMISNDHEIKLHENQNYQIKPQKLEKEKKEEQFIEDNKYHKKKSQSLVHIQNIINKQNIKSRRQQNNCIEIQQCEQNSMIDDSQSFSSEVLQLKTQEKSQNQVMNMLIQGKKYEQALQIIRSIPQSKQKYEAQITISFKQCQDNQSKGMLTSVLQLYEKHITKYNEDTPITQNTCSLCGHVVMAKLLYASKKYSQAAKHYEVVLLLLQDHNFEDGANQVDIKNIREKLGKCYVERGMHKQAIQQYQKSLELQPDNYFLMTNLCTLLLQCHRKSEAKKCYEEYLMRKDAQNIPNKVEYIYCLLNIWICDRDTEKQFETIQRILKALQKYFPTINQIKERLNEVAIVQLYLRKADLLQQKYHHLSTFSSNKKQNKKELLDVYLACLTFDSCPDREKILANAGALQYMRGCYANSLKLFNKVFVKKNLVVTRIGLSLIRLQQYEKALQFYQHVIQNNSQNVIYNASYQILKWVCGICQTQPILPTLNCGCEQIFSTRLSLGLWMLDELTSISLNNELSTAQKKDSIQNQVRTLINKLLQKQQQISENNFKIKFFISLLNSHMKICQSSKQKTNQKVIPPQILETSLKKCKNIEQFLQNSNKLLNLLQKIEDQHQQSYFIIQSAVCFAVIANIHLKEAVQTLKDLFIKSESNFLRVSKIFIETKSFLLKQDESMDKQLEVNCPLNIKILQNFFNDIQCTLQNSIGHIFEQIENIYYSNTTSIVSPLEIQHIYPHCESIDACGKCFMNSTTVFASLFGKKLSILPSENCSIKEHLQLFNQKFKEFICNCLQHEERGVYSKEDNKLKVKVEEKLIPFRIVTHHKNFEEVRAFIKNIDASSNVDNIQNFSKGIVFAIVNKSIVLEMWWGQSISIYDKFYLWLIERQSQLSQDLIFFLWMNMDQLGRQFQSKEKLQNKIKLMFQFTE